MVFGLFVEYVVLGVEELAATPIGTVLCGVELDADLRLVVLRQVLLFEQFVGSMSVRTRGLKLTFTKFFPISTNFRFVLHLVVFDEGFALLLVVEVLLGLFDCGFEENLLVLFLLLFEVSFFGLIGLALLSRPRSFPSFLDQNFLLILVRVS